MMRFATALGTFSELPLNGRLVHSLGWCTGKFDDRDNSVVPSVSNSTANVCSYRFIRVLFECPIRYLAVFIYCLARKPTQPIIFDF